MGLNQPLAVSVSMYVYCMCTSDVRMSICKLCSDLIVSVGLQQPWQNVIQVLVDELMGFDVHAGQQVRPQPGSSCNCIGGEEKIR